MANGNGTISNKTKIFLPVSLFVTIVLAVIAATTCAMNYKSENDQRHQAAESEVRVIKEDVKDHETRIRDLEKSQRMLTEMNKKLDRLLRLRNETD